MTLVRRTAAAALAYAVSLKGLSRKTGTAPWTNSTTIDDCARFCSHVLWGGRPGPISWVDNFKSAIDGQYHRGKAGLQPGDVVLFDWPPQNQVGNHVEMCLTAPTRTGAFTTIGANGSDTVAVKVRTRNAYVLGYFRPAWGFINLGAQTTPGPASAALTIHQIAVKAGDDGDMQTIHNTGNGGKFLVGKHYVRHLGSASDATLSQNVFSTIDETHELTANQTYTLFKELGIPTAYGDPTKLRAAYPDGLWSLELEIAKKLGLAVTL